MARPTPTPYVPATAPVLQGSAPALDDGTGRSKKPGIDRPALMADVWILFCNKVLEFIMTLTQRGLRADQPAATSVYPGTLYYVTDEQVTEKSNGEAWEDYTDHGAGTITAADMIVNVGAPTLTVDDTIAFWRDGLTPEGLWYRVRRGGVDTDVPIFTWP